MKTKVLVWIALLAWGGVTVQPVSAGSAVVADGHGNLCTAYGGPVDREKQRALNKARHLYGFAHFTILASTNTFGLRSHRGRAPSEWSRFACGYRFGQKVAEGSGYHGSRSLSESRRDAG
jgi:hypothetical protein